MQRRRKQRMMFIPIIEHTDQVSCTLRRNATLVTIHQVKTHKIKFNV